MYLIPIFLILNILGLVSQVSRRNKLRQSLEEVKEQEEIIAFHKAIQKVTTSITISVIALIALAILSLYILNAPTY